ncbi:MAG: hypothetical protein DRJ03_02770 [Chloroflexi bacterium]|nr:MAG: hypothetical protein DRJ03_02770 [Chloroflexota bacterium]
MEEEKSLAVVNGEGLALTTEQFEQQLQVETERRELMEKYIKGNLKKGIDYDTIPGTKKPTLLKPGAERICNLLKLRMVFRADKDTWNMLSAEKKKVGTFCYICELITPTGEIAAQGKGLAYSNEKINNVYKDGEIVGSKPWNMNTCMKIAKKRAMVDAALANGFCGLSDRFTQDMEDTSKENQNVAQNGRQGGSDGGGASPKQVNYAKSIVKNKKLDLETVLNAAKIVNLNTISKKQASMLIDGLNSGKFDSCVPGATVDTEDEEDIDLNEDPFEKEEG